MKSSPDNHQHDSIEFQYKKLMVEGNFIDALKILYQINSNGEYNQDIIVCLQKLKRYFKSVKYIDQNTNADLYSNTIQKCSSILVKYSAYFFIGYIIVLYFLSGIGFINSGKFLWFTVFLFALDILIMAEKRLNFFFTKTLVRFHSLKS